MGRPPANGTVARSKTLTFQTTPEGEDLIKRAVEKSGLNRSLWLEEAAINYANSSLGEFTIGNSTDEFAIGNPPQDELARIPYRKSATAAPKLVSQKAQSESTVATDYRTRARAPEELRNLRTKNTGSPSSSLRSSQREPSAAPASESDDSPWSSPEPIKLTIKISTGETVTNVWMFANGSKIPPADVDRVMNTPALKTFRQAMLKCFARSLRDSYRLKWCGAMNKRRNAWRDTPRSTASFLSAAKFLAAEYITRQMSASEFIDACNEMRPKAIKFVTCDLLPGIGSRVAVWIPESQRERDKTWSTHTDDDGMTWLTPIGEAPVVVLRSAADRQKFMKAHKVG